MEKIKLDALDKKLLFELDNNSRQTVSELARKLRQGRDRIDYRLQRLIELKVVKQCTVTINPYRLGFTLFKTYLKISKHKDRYQSLLSLLRSHPRIYWIADCDGGWDLIFATFAKNPYEFMQIQNDILHSCRDIVWRFTNFTLVNVWMYRKNYLVPQTTKYFLVGGAPSSYDLTRLEWELLGLLSLDARLSLSDLAKNLKITEAVVSYRLQQLEKAGLIVGYRIELDYQTLGMLYFKAQLYLQEYGPNEINALRKFCAEHPHITYFIEQIGDAPIELELEVEGYEQYTKIIDQIRIAFPKTIRNVETVMINRSRFKWVPYEKLGELET